MIEFSVNKTRANLDVDPSTPLLWVIRDQKGQRIPPPPFVIRDL